MTDTERATHALDVVGDRIRRGDHVLVMGGIYDYLVGKVGTVEIFTILENADGHGRVPDQYPGVHVAFAGHGRRALRPDWLRWVWSPEDTADEAGGGDDAPATTKDTLRPGQVVAVRMQNMLTRSGKVGVVIFDPSGSTHADDNPPSVWVLFPYTPQHRSIRTEIAVSTLVAIT